MCECFCNSSDINIVAYVYCYCFGHFPLSGVYFIHTTFRELPLYVIFSPIPTNFIIHSSFNITEEGLGRTQNLSNILAKVVKSNYLT
jgi:hypothetical protein